MNANRNTHVFAALLPLLLAAGASVNADCASAQARTGFEAAPVLAGAELAPAAFLKGPLHTVTEPVQLDGFFGRFVIESKYGTFNVVGEKMLNVRVNELPAIEALQNVQQTDSFKNALLQSASAPVQFVQGAVNNPTQTVENVAKGFGMVLGRIGYLAQSGAQAVGDAASDRNAPPAPAANAQNSAAGPAPSSFTGDPVRLQQGAP